MFGSSKLKTCNSGILHTVNEYTNIKKELVICLETRHWTYEDYKRLDDCAHSLCKHRVVLFHLLHSYGHQLSKNCIIFDVTETGIKFLSIDICPATIDLLDAAGAAIHRSSTLKLIKGWYLTNFHFVSQKAWNRESKNRPSEARFRLYVWFYVPQYGFKGIKSL